MANQDMITLKHATATALGENLLWRPQKRDIIICVGSNAYQNPKVSRKF